jgi:type IV secretory pathway VirB10-like protein
MLSNRLAFAALAVACIAAAAGGGYLATRQNTVPTPAVAQTVPASTAQPAFASTPAAPAMVPATTPVQETEAVVGDAARPADTAKKMPAAAPRRGDAKATTARTAKPAATEARRDQQPPTLTSTWPSSAAQSPSTPSTPATPEPAARPEERIAQEPPRPAEPPKPSFEELVVSANSAIGLQMENRISSETARVEDRVEARVTRDVRVGDRVAIPSGAHAIGSVTQVDRGGKFKEQARLAIRFHTIVLADGTRLPISTETITRVGEAPGNGSAAKIGGGAVGGAIIGAILGGAKGAAIGATAGAGGGAVAVEAAGRNAVVLQPGTPLTARMTAPVTVTIEK